MQTELTPKQQVTELIKQAKNILLVTGREPNNDQLAAVVAAQTVLTRLGKQVDAIITDPLPKSAELFHTDVISKDLSGIRDFIIKLKMGNVEVEKLKYQLNEAEKTLDVVITPHNGNFSADNVSYSYGTFQFDLVIAFGVPSLGKLDRILENNPTIFDGLHLINIDYHRINENYGSVNLIDGQATCACEMLISLFESLGQGLLDEYVATAIFTGIFSATQQFSSPSTTAKAMTMAAQMIAAGAKQQEVIRVLFGKRDYDRDRGRGDHRESGQKSDKPQTVKEILQEKGLDVPTLGDKKDVPKNEGTSPEDKPKPDIPTDGVIEKAPKKQSDKPEFKKPNFAKVEQTSDGAGKLSEQKDGQTAQAEKPEPKTEQPAATHTPKEEPKAANQEPMAGAGAQPLG